MVTIGYSFPYVAKYDGSSGTDKYTEGMDLGAGVSYSDSIEVAEDNNFYANNTVDESDSGTFVSGEATVTINGLKVEAAKLILGIKNTASVAETTWAKYDDDTKPTEFGYGHVKKTREKGKDQYWGFVLTRVVFNIPGETAETQEQEINWQTQELTATILRSINGKHEWRAVTETPFESEQEAYDAVKAYLSQTGA